MSLRTLYTASVVLALLFASAAQSAHPVYRGSVDGPAIEGFDTVAYFTLGVAVAGQPEFSHEWQNTTWLFATEEHRALFVANPEKYAPQFGGYCAYAVGKNRLYKGHPNVFTIEDGKLYFNNNRSVREKWGADPENFILRAQENFPRLLQPGLDGESDNPAAR